MSVEWVAVKDKNGVALGAVSRDMLDLLRIAKKDSIGPAGPGDGCPSNQRLVPNVGANSGH